MQLDHHLVHFFQDRDFSLSRLITGHSPIASVRRGLTTPYVLLASPVSSPCPDANGGIDLLENWLTLRLVRVNQMRKGESSEFSVMEGY